MIFSPFGVVSLIGLGAWSMGYVALAVLGSGWQWGALLLAVQAAGCALADARDMQRGGARA